MRLILKMVKITSNLILYTILTSFIKKPTVVDNFWRRYTIKLGIF